MRRLILTKLLLLFLCGYALAASPIGYWQRLDNTQEGRIVIRIFPNNDRTFSAKIIQYPGNHKARCTACQGELANQTIIGMVFMKNLRKTKENQWQSDYFVDFSTGKIKKITLTIDQTGNQLQIGERGLLSSLKSDSRWIRRR